MSIREKLYKKVGVVSEDAAAQPTSLSSTQRKMYKALGIQLPTETAASAAFEIPTAYGPQKPTVERVRTHLAEAKNTAAKERYGQYQKNVKRIGEIEGLLSSPYMKLKTTTGDRKEYDELTAEKKKLETANRVYENRYKPYDERYAKYAGAEGWEDATAYRQYNLPTVENLAKYGYADIIDGEWQYVHDVDESLVQVEDPLGTYMDAMRNGGTHLAPGTDDGYASTAGGHRTPAKHITDYNKAINTDNHWELLDSEEVNMYYALLKTQGKDAAMAFLNDMAVELGRRYQGEQQSDLEDAGFWETVGHNLLSVPANVAGGIAAAPRDLLSLAKGEQINPYDKNHALMNYGQNVRGVTAGKIDEATGASDSDFITWGDAYQGVMSGVDSAVAAVALGGAGAAVVLGTNAGAAEAKELFEKGASQGEMVAGGLLAGATEAVFEKVSIGYFLDDVLQKPSKNIAQSLMKTLGMAGVEASEEFCTTLGNYITDAAVRSSTSDFVTMVEEYEEQGYTHGAAVWETLKAVGGEALHSAAIGAISGAGMGAGGSVVNGSVSGEAQYSLSEKTPPAYEELTAKKPIHIVDVTEGLESGSYAEMKKGVQEKAKAEGWLDKPHHNEDTNSLIFLTNGSFTHAYSNLQSNFGEDTIRTMAHIPEIIRDAVLVSVDPPKNPNKAETKVYTFFGAIKGTRGIEPVKLTVKEFEFKSLDRVPQNIRSYFEQNGVMESYNSLYDAKALEVIGIEGIKKEPDASGKGNGKDPQARATSDSEMSITDLLNLVNGDARKYIPSATSEARARWMGTPSVTDGDTSLGEGGYGADAAMRGVEDAAPYRSATTPMGDVQVVERALQLTAEGKRKATASDFDGILQELGEEETLKRLYNSQQFDRPTGMVEINGRRVDAGAYVDAYEQSLPDDPAALRQVIRHLEKQHTAEVLKMEQEGTLNDYKPHRLKIDLQLFAAKRKMELLQLEPGEDGSKVRQFWEKRLNGNDEMHSEELLELMAGRTETYDPISNQETLNKARDKFMEDGYRSRLLKQLGKRSSARRLTEVDVAAAIELTRKAYNDGDYEVMMDLIAGLSRRGTELGRAVQAFSMMARMTPEGVLKAAHRTLQKDADYVIGEGASEGLDELSKKLAKALEQLNRLKGSEIQSPRPESSNGEGAVEDADVQVTENESNGQRVTVQASREDVVGALADDLAATEGTYLTREDIEANLEKVIKDATDVPEQVKRYVLKKLRKGDGGLAQRLYELHRKGHLTADATRRAMEQALELPTLTDEDVKTLVEMAERVQELTDDPVKQADAMEDIYDFLGAKMTVKFGDWLQAWRKFAMLANVKTHVRNMVSNGAYAGIRKVNDLISMGLERMFRVPADQRGAYLGWQNTKHGQDIMPAIRKNAELAVLEMQKRGAKYETSTGQLKQHRKFFGTGKIGEFFNNLSGKNSEWLEREDIWCFKPAYIDALGQMMTAREKTEITPDMHEKAMQRALEATFRADNAISDVLTSLKRYQNSDKNGLRLFGHAVDVVIPFSKTPANIAVQTVMHSPVGIAKGAFDLIQRARGKSAATTADIINEFSKGITGTALGFIGFLLGSAGLFNTGFGKTEKERAADELAGRQENAIIIGDTSITLDWLQPVAAPLIVGASIGQRMREDEISAASVFGAVMDGTDSLFELSMLQSLYDVLGGYDAGATATAASVGENVVSQSIPTLMGQAARSIDPVQRKTAGDSDFETIVNQVLAKIPGLTYLLDPELDVWGNEVHRTGKPSGGGTALNAAQQFALPWNTKTGTGAGDYVSEEILRLYDEYGSQVIPTAISRDDAKDKGLDYVEDNRILGAVNRTAVEDFINDVWPYRVQEELPNGKTRTVTKFYSEMTDDERRRVLSRIYQKSKETVTGETEDTKTKSKQDRYFEQLFEEMK